MKKHVFEPSGLKSTTYSYDIAKRTGHLANGIGREGVNKSQDLFGKGTPRPMEYWNKAGADIGSCKVLLLFLPSLVLISVCKS